MGRTLVVGDVHGHPDLLRAALEAYGIIDGEGIRVDLETRVVQIGDLANCVASDVDDDLEVLEAAAGWLDVLLVGNHEHPYYGGPAFAGFFRSAAVEAALSRLDAIVLPALAVGDVLVTHAGVTTAWEWRSAAEAEDALLGWWKDDPGRSPAFSDIGATRGGYARYGGILWADKIEPKSQRFVQVVGHTPSRRHPLRLGSTYYIDAGGRSGGRLGGVLLNGGVELLEPVTIRTVP